MTEANYLKVQEAARNARTAEDVLRLLLEHGSWYLSAIELDFPELDGNELREISERILGVSPTSPEPQR